MVVVVECGHCEGTGTCKRCSDRWSCHECCSKAGYSASAKIVVRCCVCGGTGKAIL